MTTAACIIAYLTASFIAASLLGRMIRATDDDADARGTILTGFVRDHDEPGSGR